MHSVNFGSPLGEWLTLEGKVEIFRKNGVWKATLQNHYGERLVASQISFKDYSPNLDSDIDAEDFFKSTRATWKDSSLGPNVEIRLRGLIGGGGCFPIKTIQWENHLRNVVVHPKKIISPDSLSQLLEALANNKGLKAAGSGHSYNPLCDTSGTLVLTDNLCHFANEDTPLTGQLKCADLYPKYANNLLINQKINKQILTSPSPIAFVEVEAGIKIKNLVENLDALGMAVYNLGGANVQTVAGAFSTSTHGSGINFGPLHSCVRSLVLCTDSPLFKEETDKKSYVYRIEPTDGITDPSKYQHKDIVLVQNDQVFNTVNVSIGCCGIIYSYVLEVIPTYKLAEYRKVDTWDSLKKQLERNEKNPSKLPSLLIENRHVELVINPYLTKKNKSQKALITIRNIWNDEQSAYKGPIAEERNFLVQMSKCELITGLLSDWIINHPKDIPAILDTSLDTLSNPDFPYVAKSYEVFNIGSNSNAGFALEFVFSITDMEGNYKPDQLFKALNRLFELAPINAEKGKYQSAPVSVRFIKGDSAYLSMMNQEPMTNQLFGAIELLMVNSTDDTQDDIDLSLLEDLEREMSALGARVHWGLDAVVSQNKLQNYSQISLLKWKEIHDKLNAKGTFDNFITDLLF